MDRGRLPAMKNKLTGFVTVLGLTLGAMWWPATPVRADDTGLAQALHDVRREGRKLCQVGHFHTGTSAGVASKKAAMAQAIDSWQSFTAMEYGTDWARYRIAGTKSSECKVSPSGWSCEVEARPCKRLSRRR
jgi:hypothetical protein